MGTHIDPVRIKVEKLKYLKEKKRKEREIFADKVRISKARRNKVKKRQPREEWNEEEEEEDIEEEEESVLHIQSQFYQGFNYVAATPNYSSLMPSNTLGNLRGNIYRPQ